MIILSLLILISYFSPLVSSSSQGDALVQQSYEESMVVSEDVRMLSVGALVWIERSPAEKSLHFTSRRIPREILRLPHGSLVLFSSGGIYLSQGAGQGGSGRILSIVYGGREKVSPYTLSGGNLRGVVDDIYGTGIIIEQSHITDILHLLSAAPEYIPACHTFGHELGHESLDLYGFVGAFSQVSDADTGMNNCISGYLHGIIEHSITKNPKLLEDPETICSGFSDDSVYGRNCAHGIGHGTMIIEKRHVDRSIAICADLTGVRARDECYGGVWMELFWGEPSHAGVSSLGWNPDDPIATCQKAEPGQQPYCYFYIYLAYYRYHKETYSHGLITLCQSSRLGSIGTAYCFKGMGRGYRGLSPRSVESKLSSLNRREKYAFYRGIFPVQSSENAGEYCHALLYDGDICRSALTAQRNYQTGILMDMDEYMTMDLE